MKTTTTVYSLKNSVNEIITEKTKIASLLNLKFSKLGQFFESRNYTVDLPMVREQNTLVRQKNTKKTETFPAELQRADITPLFKKGDLEDPLNYRSISLTPALAKVFESLIKQQIDEYVHKNALLSKTQFEIRKKNSTTDALVYLTEKYDATKPKKKLLQRRF